MQMCKYVFSQFFTMHINRYNICMHRFQTPTDMASRSAHVIWLCNSVCPVVISRGLYSRNQNPIPYRFVSAKLGREHCSPEDMCPAQMQCIHGRCQCVTGSMTSDLRFCRESNYKLLREGCDRDWDICFHMSGQCYLVFRTRLILTMTLDIDRYYYVVLSDLNCNLDPTVTLTFTESALTSTDLVTLPDDLDNTFQFSLNVLALALLLCAVTPCELPCSAREYTDSDATCSMMGVCRCKKGFKAQGQSCTTCK